MKNQPREWVMRVVWWSKSAANRNRRERESRRGWDATKTSEKLVKKARVTL
jgi:hypothetical protein